MKKNLIFSLVVLVTCFNIISAQEKAVDKNQMSEKSSVKKETVNYTANPADAATIDSIIKATYDSISGKTGEKRDWNRFRSLFHPDARLIPSGKNPQTGIVAAQAFTPDEYIERSEKILEQGFFEKEISRKTQQFGNIAHIFSTYEGRKKLSDKAAFVRGINSFQLLNDGKRWWILTIYWQAETPAQPIPSEFLD